MTTFEEYVGWKKEIGRQMAQRVIRASLVYRSLDAASGAAKLAAPLPLIESQVRVLADNVAVFE